MAESHLIDGDIPMQGYDPQVSIAHRPFTGSHIPQTIDPSILSLTSGPDGGLDADPPTSTSPPSLLYDPQQTDLAVFTVAELETRMGARYFELELCNNKITELEASVDTEERLNDPRLTRLIQKRSALETDLSALLKHRQQLRHAEEGSRARYSLEGSDDERLPDLVLEPWDDGIETSYCEKPGSSSVLVPASETVTARSFSLPLADIAASPSASTEVTVSGRKRRTSRTKLPSGYSCFDLAANANRPSKPKKRQNRSEESKDNRARLAKQGGQCFLCKFQRKKVRQGDTWPSVRQLLSVLI